MHIGIAGNIGSGKTTLTRMLSEHYGWTPKYESVDVNPYLEDYYKDIPRWSYNLETYFLAQRFKDVLEISGSPDVIVQDRTLMEGVNIFVVNNHEQGNLSDRDYDTYMQLYRLMISMAGTPDLLIYLKASVPHLVDNIRRRGRDFEQGMTLDYLQGLNIHYESWISSYEGQLLVVEADELDFEHNPDDFAVITDKIDAQLFGLFK